MRNKKKLLIPGGGHADIPLIRAAKKLGFHVITSGNRPKDPGHKEADEYSPCDFSDAEALLLVAKDKRIDAICSSCNDFSATSSAFVAEQMHLPGHDSYITSQLIHHKDSYRKFAHENRIPTPIALACINETEAKNIIHSGTLAYPLMIKPVDLTGGKGIKKVQNALQAKHAIKKAFAISKSKRVVIEEFVGGSNHGFSTFIHNEKVVFYFSDNEHYHLNKYMVSAASTPTTSPQTAIDTLIRQTEKIATTLKLKTGIFHIQYILNNKGKPIIIEACRRAPGDLYIDLVKVATGVDYSEWIIRAAAGMDCSKLTQHDTNGNYTRHCIMPPQTGTLKDVHVNPLIKNNIIYSHHWWKKGDHIEDHLTHKLGIVFLKFDTKEEMIEKTNILPDLIRPEIAN